MNLQILCNPSMKTAQFHGQRRNPSMKTAQNMDDRTKITHPSIKSAHFMDGEAIHP